MAEGTTLLNDSAKKDKYQKLLPQIRELVLNENDPIANMANISAILKEAFQFLWVGFYIVKTPKEKDKEKELVLGPFQGQVACSRIKYNNGVCGTAWKEKKVIIVPNVHQFDGHIFCDPNSLSEIVIPVIFNSEVIAILDIDSEKENNFDHTDSLYLQKMMSFFMSSLQEYFFY